MTSNGRFWSAERIVLRILDPKPSEKRCEIEIMRVKDLH